MEDILYAAEKELNAAYRELDRVRREATPPRPRIHALINALVQASRAAVRAEHAWPSPRRDSLLLSAAGMRDRLNEQIEDALDELVGEEA